LREIGEEATDLSSKLVDRDRIPNERVFYKFHNRDGLQGTTTRRSAKSELRRHRILNKSLSLVDLSLLFVIGLSCFQRTIIQASPVNVQRGDVYRVSNQDQKPSRHFRGCVPSGYQLSLPPTQKRVSLFLSCMFGRFSSIARSRFS
jgi:hypothetical protein